MASALILVLHASAATDRGVILQPTMEPVGGAAQVSAVMAWVSCLEADQQQAEQSGKEVDVPLSAQPSAMLTTSCIAFNLRENTVLQRTTDRTQP